MPNGRVKWFSWARGYGSIKQDDGTEIYVCRSAIRGGRQVLEKGQKVQFEIVQRPGGPQAENVVRLHMLF